MDEYIRETKRRLSEVMGKLGWNPEDLKSAPTYSVCRYDDKHHVPRQDLVKHELLCSLKKQGLTSAEAETAHDTGFCYAESRSVASFSLTHSEIKNVLMSRCTSDRYSLEDLNVHRLLTPAERLALYEYLIEKARFEGKVHNIPEHQLLFLDNEEEKEAAQAGLTLGQLRDLKRRRPSYRAKNVHVTKKSYTERMREVLDNQFKMLEDIRKDPELLALYKKRMAARASSVQPQPNSEASAQRERSESRSRVPEKVSVDDKWQHDKFDPSEGLRDRRSMSRQSDRRHSGEFDPRYPRNARSQSRDGRDFRTSDYRDRSRDPARGSQSRDSAPRDRRESAPPRDHREISRDHRSASRDGSRGDERSRGYEDARGSSSRGHSASRYEQKMAADEYDDRMAPRDYQRSTSRDHHERSSRDRSSSRVRSHVEVRTEYDVPRSRSRTRSRSHRSDSKHKKRKKESKSRERSVKKKKKKLSDKKSRKRKHRHEEREKRKSKKEKRKHKHKKSKRRKLEEEEEEEDEFEEEMSSDEELSDDSDVDSDDVTSDVDVSDVDDSDDEDVSVSEEENSEEAESEEADGDEEEKEDLSEEEQEEEELSGSDPSLSPSD